MELVPAVSRHRTVASIVRMEEHWRTVLRLADAPSIPEDCTLDGPSSGSLLPTITTTYSVFAGSSVEIILCTDILLETVVQRQMNTPIHQQK